jgi:hypothetical protein
MNNICGKRSGRGVGCVQRWYTCLEKEQSQYEFDDLGADFLRLNYSKGVIIYGLVDDDRVLYSVLKVPCFKD